MHSLGMQIMEYHILQYSNQKISFFEYLDLKYIWNK